MPNRYDLFFQLTNEALTASIVIVAASMLLYNLTRNRDSRVMRASSVLLACVTIVNTVDVFVSLNPTTSALQVWLRVQWVGIAYAPAAMFHLSSALLATTGLLSRGRRRRVTRILYVFSFLFTVMALFTDALVAGYVETPAPHLLAGPVFPLYVTFFLLATIVSVYNVLRARQRCLTTYTHRRMGYLLYSFTLPAFGIFPYSLLFGDAGGSSLLFWLLVNLSNLGIILMLLFMAYPLSFFASSIPDRVVKAELLRFFLRGPAVGILVLFVILYMPQAGRILGLPGEEFMPFAAVAVLMFWQWMVSLSLPYLERSIVYPDEQAQMRMVQSVSQRLLTHSDLSQLLEAILAATCDLVQVPVAFLVNFEGEQAHVLQAFGDWQPGDNWSNGSVLLNLLKHHSSADMDDSNMIVLWDTFWVVPLYSRRMGDDPVNGGEARLLLGAIGVHTPAGEQDLPVDDQHVFDMLVDQAAQALDDRLLQREVFAALEGLLPEMDAIQQLRDTARYGDYPSVAYARRAQALPGADDGFVEAVRDALRDYWGGPRLTTSPLLNLGIVQAAMADHADNPTLALRTVLLDAINRLRPGGDRSMTNNEWTLYNILELRFIQGYKVRSVARRLVMSEADLYRKQRLAIEEVARFLIEAENSILQEQQSTR